MDYLPALCIFKLPDLVGKLNHLGRFDKNGLPGGRFIMNETIHFSLVPCHHRNYRSVIPEGRRCFCIYPSLSLRFTKDLVQLFRNRSLPLLLTPSDLVKCSRSIIADFSVLIQNLLDALMNKRKYFYRFTKFFQGRIILLIIGFEEMQNRTDGVQALHQSENLLRQQVCSLHLCLFQRLPVVNKMLNGEIILVLTDNPEFLNQIQFPVNEFVIGHEFHLIYQFLPRIKQAMRFNQLTDAVKSDLYFKLFGIYQECLNF